MVIGLDKIKKRANEKGITILEALVSTAIIGIGFIAVFQMVQYSIRSIDVSGERTKMNYLVSMIAEDIISDRDSIDSSKSVFLDVFNLLLEGALIFGDVIGINFLNQTFA